MHKNKLKPLTSPVIYKVFGRAILRVKTGERRGGVKNVYEVTLK